MKRLLTAIGLIALSTPLTGCYAHLYSPPARVDALEGAKPVEHGRTSVGASAGTHGEVFGFDATTVSVRARHGVSDHAEVGFDANLARLNENDAATPVDPNIWSARVGGKLAPAALHDYAAVIGGVGAGTSAGGKFISPDVGLVLAFENPYLVPFASIDGFVSQPIDARPVDISTTDEGAGTHVAKAQRTWGATAAAGLKVPIDIGRSRVAPYAGMSLTRMTDGEEPTGVIGASAGVDVTF